MKINSTYLFIYLVVYLFKINAQVNLVQNGSFESYNNPVDCNGGGGFFNITFFPATRVVNSWDVYTSPDYFNSVCTNTYTGMPQNIFGYQYAKSGSSYSGISTYWVNEYITQQLQAPLQTGKVYCLSFWVSRADRKEIAIKQIGALFSNNLPIYNSNNYISATPQIVNTSGVITDTIAWQQIQGCFTANGGEEYITIGNFNSNANTDTLNLGTNNPIPSDPPYAYYYIDSVSLWEDTTVGIQKQSNKSEVFSVWPNPAQEILNVDCRLLNEELTIKIVDVVGREIFEQQYSKEIDVSSLEKGIYFLSIHNKEKLIGTKKFVKQ